MTRGFPADHVSLVKIITLADHPSGGRSVLLSAILSSLSLLLLASEACSAPAPPEYGVNHQTRECATLFMGDECVSCRMPEEWTSLGVGHRDLCPEGYRKVEKRAVCEASKNEFCCTQGHSGAPGNCKDLVIHAREKKCAFVDDISKCSLLPEGWQRPQGQPVCPFRTHTWMHMPLACRGEYAPPTVNGMRVDWCLAWGKDCGQPAADRFCRSEGYARAETWRKEPADISYIMGDGKTCSGRGTCHGFSFIRCEGGN